MSFKAEVERTCHGPKTAQSDVSAIDIADLMLRADAFLFFGPEKETVAQRRAAYQLFERWTSMIAEIFMNMPGLLDEPEACNNKRLCTEY